MMLQHPAFLDRELCKELLEISKQDTSYTTVIGKTMCTYDFYEGKQATLGDDITYMYIIQTGN